jgi:hypothetical protein
MLDLCAGLGGASAAFRQAGWQVITLDYDGRFNTDIVADVRTWSWHGRRPDLIWASPPCDEFSREFMPWSKTGNTPALDIVAGCKRVIDEAQPKAWVIENVIGAVSHFRPLLGNYRAHYGPFYLWGDFPDIGRPSVVMRKKESMSSKAHEERAMIPAGLSLAMLRAITTQPKLEMTL